MKRYFLILILGIMLMGAGGLAGNLFWPHKTENRASLENQSIMGTIKLPPPKLESKTSVEKALQERRSIREYKNEPLALEVISQLLWAAQGLSDPGKELRTCPSAGALYPLEVYLTAGKVTGLPAGVFKYRPKEHELVKMVEGDKRTELYAAALSQSAVKEAAATLIFSAVYERTTAKYGERGIRYVHMEVGHAAQNVYLQVASLDLGTVAIGAFDDAAVKKAINLAANEEPLYLMPIGKR